MIRRLNLAKKQIGQMYPAVLMRVVLIDRIATPFGSTWTQDSGESNRNASCQLTATANFDRDLPIAIRQ
jgi:hypothetical protein